MAFDGSSLPALLEDARSLLERELSSAVTIDDAVEIESDNEVLRARLSAGSVTQRSIVIKRVTDTGFDLPGHEGAPQRLLNEWAGLEFITEVGGGRVVAPTLIAGDAAACLLVIEDLGELESLESLLLGGQKEKAERGLEGFGAALGRLHGLAWGRESRFAEIQEEVGTRSPMSDTTVDQRTRRDLFTACFEEAGVVLKDRLWRSVEQVEELIHGQSPFRSLVHADAGPHNALVSEGTVRLIDFEFCVFHNGLSDVVGARLGFPQTTNARPVPDEHVRWFETAYRETLAEHIMVAEDDRLFRRSLAAAAAHWALNRTAAAWQLHIRPRLESGPEPAEVEVQRLSSTMLLIDGFVAHAREEQLLEELADALDACGRAWRELWPAIAPIHPYPALRNTG